MTRDLEEQLSGLGLRHTAEILDDIVALATKNRWGAQQPPLRDHQHRGESYRKREAEQSKEATATRRRRQRA